MSCQLKFGGFMAEEIIVRGYRDGDEEAIVNLLNTAFGYWGNLETWRWRYRENPWFEPEGIRIAEKDGKIIGCNHRLARDVKLGETVLARAAMYGDGSVLPEYRGQNIFPKLIQTGHEYEKSSGALMWLGVTRGDLAKMWVGKLGRVPVDKVTMMIKFFSPYSAVRSIVFTLNSFVIRDGLQDELRKLDPRILVRMPNATFYIQVGKSGTFTVKKVRETNGQIRPNVTLEGDVQSITQASESALTFLKLFLMRRIKVSGEISKLLKLRSLLSGLL